MEGKEVPWGWAKAHFLTHIWQTYRLTREAYKIIFQKQDGKCPGCLQELAHPWDRGEMRMGLKPEVDHCHKAGHVRGLLCRGCNDFLGKIADDKDKMIRLVDYLKRNGDW